MISCPSPLPVGEASKPMETRQLAAVRPHIVVAEDDDSLRELLVVHFELMGFHVTEVADGAQLVDLIADLFLNDSSPPSIDLVISDICMPGWSGLQALATFRTAGLTVPLILMTAFGDEATLREAKKLGVIEVLDKPFNLEVLRRAVYRALGREDRTARKKGNEPN